MIKKTLFILTILLLVTGVTGCGKEENIITPTPSFTMVCTTKIDKSSGFESQTVINYEFNSEQYASNYSTSTTQIFDNEDVYKQYKEKHEKTLQDNNDENVMYDLRNDDKNMTLIFTMTVKNPIKNAKTKEDKNKLKASTILKKNEENKATCELNGIKKSQLK